MKHGKKYNDSAKLIETGKFYDTEEAVSYTHFRAHETYG